MKTWSALRMNLLGTDLIMMCIDADVSWRALLGHLLIKVLGPIAEGRFVALPQRVLQFLQLLTDVSRPA
ncbi:MAG: hypothetical protein BGO63_15340 [Candidatus Accumulibacter sp. 66-26]|nr:MAG: hypothetical protein BGO63_15340 [Candidatus Accumulibacter sp. 66-26]